MGVGDAVVDGPCLPGTLLPAGDAGETVPRSGYWTKRNSGLSGGTGSTRSGLAAIRARRGW